MKEVKLTPKQAAAEFVNACKEKGWSWSIRGQVVTVQKNFTPGDNEAYVICEGEAYGLLERCPLKGGSIWGTDGGSIGGAVGVECGYYRLNKSGETGKAFIKQLQKLA